MMGRSGMTSSELAAWVQAIGSVFAIFVAVFVPAWQNRMAQQQLERDRRAFIRAIVAVADRAEKATVSVVSNICEYPGAIRANGVETYDLPELKDILDSLTLQDVRSDKLFVAVLDLRHSVAGVIDLARTAERDTEVFGGPSTDTDEKAENVVEHVRRHVATLRAASSVDG